MQRLLSALRPFGTSYVGAVVTIPVVTVRNQISLRASLAESNDKNKERSRRAARIVGHLFGLNMSYKFLFKYIIIGDTGKLQDASGTSQSGL